MKTKARFHKLTAWLLTVAMLMTFIPSFTLGVSAAGTTEKNITLGTSALKGGQASNIHFGNFYQSDASGQKKRPDQMACTFKCRRKSIFAVRQKP